MADPYTVNPTTHPDSPERWSSALARALDAGLMIRPGMFGGPLWTVTSKSRPDLCYAVTATVCGCAAAEHGDPVCQHRALYRYVTGQFGQPTPAPVPANGKIVFLHTRRQSSPQGAA